MAGEALQVEPMAETTTTVTAGEGASASGSEVLYLWQIALLAARAGALERELQRERRERQRVIERYEALLGKRDATIEDLRAERDDRDGVLQSLLTR